MSKKLCGILGIIFLLFLTVIAVQAADDGYAKVANRDILNNSSYVGKEVVIEGNITQECDGRGCWLTVDDGTGVTLVDLEPNNFTIPLNQIGNHVVVCGTVKPLEGKKFLTFEPRSPIIVGKRWN